MKKSWVGGWILVGGLAALSGCAQTSVKDQVNTELAHEPNVRANGQVDRDAAKAIATAPGLTDDQRTELTSLRTTTVSSLQILGEEALKLKELLIQEVVSEHGNPGQVEEIKRRLTAVESKKLSVLFDSISQANLILGHQASAHPELINEFVSPGRIGLD